MKRIFIFASIIFVISGYQIAAASSTQCHMGLFSQTELNKLYSNPNQAKTLRTFLPMEAKRIISFINKLAAFESSSAGYRACKNSSHSCSGEDKDWHYDKTALINGFGSVLAFNGGMRSKKLSRWSRNGSTYATWVQITCSWNKNESWCIEQCVVNEVYDGFHG